MNIKLNRTLAKEAGQVNIPNYPNESWEDVYTHHLGAVEKPFPFEVFRTKFLLLDKYLSQDPDGKNNKLDNPIQNLCLELGY